jgi:hypothetical protein
MGLDKGMISISTHFNYYIGGMIYKQVLTLFYPDLPII